MESRHLWREKTLCNESTHIIKQTDDKRKATKATSRTAQTIVQQLFFWTS